MNNHYISLVSFSLLFILNIFLSGDVVAQTLSGTVRDPKNNELLIGASVVIKGTTIGSVTDFNGKFSFNAGRKPPFTVVVSFIGYVAQEMEVTDLNAPMVVKLKKDEILLEGVVINETRISELQKESPLTIESMDVIAIKETPAANFYEGLGTLKGVDLTSASIGFKIINTRGFNSTSPVRSLQLIDGVDNQAPGLNFSLGNFLGAPDLDVLKVDLIVGASSAFYGPNAFNGVLSMTTKSPFVQPGLTVSFKAAERSMVETAFRWAQVIKNKKNEDKFAYKLNFFFLRANDWEATNLDPIQDSKVGINNPGKYDAVNRYGDENLSDGINNATSISQQIQYPGLGRWYRTGYEEKDVVDYNAWNLKAGAAFHYKLKPDVELIFANNLGTGTTVYQGDNRYSLKNILFIQNRLEIKKEGKYFLRAFTTREDGGKSYDAVFTAFLLQDASKGNINWSTDYRNFWNGAINPSGIPNAFPGGIKAKVKRLPGMPPDALALSDPTEYIRQLNSVLALYSDSLKQWHEFAANYANNYNSGNGSPYLVPGSDAFVQKFNSITSKKSYAEGGTLFHDKSALYNIQGEYKFKPSFMEITAGGNFRLYTPVSDGTIFSDTLTRSGQSAEILSRTAVGDSLLILTFTDPNTDIFSTYTFGSDNRWNNVRIISHGPGTVTIAPMGQFRFNSEMFKTGETIHSMKRMRITNMEAGIYLGAEKKFFDEKLKINVTTRVDKNQNFNFLISPAASAVYTVKNNHTFRFSFSAAIRNPTLADQYLYYNVGRALLIGNIKGVDSLVTVTSLVSYFNTPNLNSDSLEYINIAPVRPEKVKTFEIGYRGTLFKKLYIDGGYYFSMYNDFLGFKLAADIAFDPILNRVTNVQVYRVAANASDMVTTQGIAIGTSYFFKKNYSLNGNYSWNVLNLRGSSDPIIPAFNTPAHKYNLGISGRDVEIPFLKLKYVGFNINYKWIQGFTFEGSPQFTGFVPTYDMVDMQINKRFPKIFSTFKLGASNVLNNKVSQVYGGPRIGRLAYFSILVELNKN